MPEAGLRTALLVAVLQASPAVDGWRERTCHAKPSAGVPPHVTILFPFVPASRVTKELEAELRRLFAAFETFPVVLDRTARFESALYLAPREAAPFVRLTRTVARAYPEHPPYGGAIEDIVPHVTVAEGDASTLDEAENEVSRALPITTRAVDVVLLEELELDAKRWRVRATLPLGASS